MRDEFIDPKLEPELARHLDLEDMLEASMMRSDRKNYFDRQNVKGKSDIKIAEHYLLQAYQCRMSGLPMTAKLDERQIKFLIKAINDHAAYFTGSGMLGGLGI